MIGVALLATDQRLLDRSFFRHGLAPRKHNIVGCRLPQLKNVLLGHVRSKQIRAIPMAPQIAKSSAVFLSLLCAIKLLWGISV